MDVKKIVRCLPEQFRELLETGQVEVDGKIKTKEDGAIYDTGYLEFIEWHNKFMQAQYEQVKVNHTPMAMKSLEQEYEELTTPVVENGVTVEEEKASAYVSAVGFTAVLKGGDTIRTGAPNSGCFYINGERLTHDYTYNGDGYEVVNVWCFEGKPEAGNPLIVPPQLNDTPTFNITELDVRNIAQTPVVGDSYKNYALTLKAYNFEISGLATRKLVSNGTDAFNQSSVASTVEEVESDCVVYGTNSVLTKKNTLKKANFPELIKIDAGYMSFLNSCTSPDLEIYYPKLQTIQGYKDQSPFYKVENVIIPSTVKTITSIICSANKTITLNCNKADSISSEWCLITPTVNFDMCGDWYPSINIAVAAARHSIDWFFPRYDETGKLKYATPLFTHILHNFAKDNEDALSQAQPGEEVILQSGWIKLPAAIYEQMTAEDRELAASIGWDLLDDPYKTTEV